MSSSSPLNTRAIALAERTVASLVGAARLFCCQHSALNVARADALMDEVKALARIQAVAQGRSTRKRTGQREEDQSSSSAVEEEPRRGADEQEARAEEDSASVQEDTGAEATKRMLRRQRLLRESGVLASPSAQGAAASNDGVGGPVNPKP